MKKFLKSLIMSPTKCRDGFVESLGFIVQLTVIGLVILILITTLNR